MYSVRYSKQSNELLDISNEVLPDIDNEITNVKIFEGDKPDILKYIWNKQTLDFDLREIESITTTSKITFRRRFTFEQQVAIDEFNETYMDLPYLSIDQKRMIRTGLKNYEETNDINLLDPFIPMLLQLYFLVGIITEEDKIKVMEINNG